jgi:hypothetical protein
MQEETQINPESFTIQLHKENAIMLLSCDQTKNVSDQTAQSKGCYRPGYAAIVSRSLATVKPVVRHGF